MALSDDSVRGAIAIIIVVSVLGVSACLALLPLAAGVYNAPDYISMLKDFGSLFGGLVGTVLGYYFGKAAR
jgi:hypothetical protein